jgi:hypothetical protein
MNLRVIFSLLHGSLVHLEKEINDNSIPKIWEPSPKRKSLEYSWQRKKLHVVYMMIRGNKRGQLSFLLNNFLNLSTRETGFRTCHLLIINSSSRTTLHGNGKKIKRLDQKNMWYGNDQHRRKKQKRNNQQRNQRRGEADWQRQIAGGGRGSGRSGFSYKLQNLVESRARRSFALLIYILVPNKMMNSVRLSDPARPFLSDQHVTPRHLVDQEMFCQTNLIIRDTLCCCISRCLPNSDLKCEPLRCCPVSHPLPKKLYANQNIRFVCMVRGYMYLPLLAKVHGELSLRLPKHFLPTAHFKNIVRAPSLTECSPMQQLWDVCRIECASRPT